MGLFAFAWLFGEGLIIWRWAKNHAPPTPGALLLPSAFFLGLAVLAQYEPARATAIALAWGVDLAVVLQVVGKNPGVVTGWPPGPIPDTQIWPSRAAGGPSGRNPLAGGIVSPATAAQIGQTVTGQFRSNPPTPSGNPSTAQQLTGGV